MSFPIWPVSVDTGITGTTQGQQIGRGTVLYDVVNMVNMVFLAIRPHLAAPLASLVIALTDLILEGRIEPRRIGVVAPMTVNDFSGFSLIPRRSPGAVKPRNKVSVMAVSEQPRFALPIDRRNHRPATASAWDFLHTCQLAVFCFSVAHLAFGCRQWPFGIKSIRCWPARRFALLALPVRNGETNSATILAGAVCPQYGKRRLAFLTG